MENYEKIRLVGRGAFGTVYLCNQKSDNKLVITKEIPVDQMTVEERQVSMNEAKVLSMLDHPNVVAYYESFLEDKTMIIVMEYVQGGTLFDYLVQRNGKLMTEEEVLHYFGQMVYTLQHVHSKLILHRDLKSQNILLNERKNIVKIGDFGISKVLSSKSKAYTVVGTPCYISPELCEGKPYNQKSDIWALGCILYELMTLKRPFHASTLPALIMKIMKGSFDPVEGIYSHELRKLLLSMLHLDHNQRPTAAQIMCHPVMIRVIFKLYVDIGSIPCNKSPQNEQTFPKFDSSKLSHSHMKSASDDSQSSKVIPKSKKCLSVLLFENRHSNAILLPNPPKAVVKSISLGAEDKIGITGNGLLISWRIRPVISINSDEKKPENQVPSYIPHVIDEKVAINIVSVVSGSSFSICLSDNGVVFAFGKASSGCLGLSCDRDINQPRIVEPLFNHDIKSIACGPKHVLAFSEENDVFVWGHGSSGCLGLGETNFQLVPQLVQIEWKEKPEKIYCGTDCSFIITKDSSLLACGSNRHNKLAMDSSEGHQIDETRFFTKVRSEQLQDVHAVSVSSGKSHTVILNEAGELYSMGSNRFGQLGWGKPGLDYCMPQRIEKLKDVKVSQVSCGDTFTLIVTHDKELLCCGRSPSSLTSREESVSYNIKNPKCLEKKRVHYISSYGENCIVLAEDQ
ncbi:serine/threonine-protein kinase Nek8-like isoform X2 [Argiope bruennichi]|uniref:serine/threonine-protein kinase Nek8-like isoform X2 n=1 Tax=Argiope bruennichi TaxID=94029 RepID=UPI0024949172|nr:serine/threonine-protein kinase Nek8-like isoform X2 [Argiope bruennichi]